MLLGLLERYVLMVRSLRYMTTVSTVRKVALPKASRAFPVKAPGPHIVLVLVSMEYAEDLREVMPDSVVTDSESREYGTEWTLRWRGTVSVDAMVMVKVNTASLDHVPKSGTIERALKWRRTADTLYSTLSGIYR